MEPNQRQMPDGRVELIDPAPIQGSPLYNHDLAPVPVSRRNWTTYNYAALWISMAHCIPTYMLASGLMAQGMNWKRSEEHTSELQSRLHLVCRLLLEKKKKKTVSVAVKEL